MSDEAQARPQWGSSLEFILTVIGYAVGLGNVWRFPFLVFKNGGAAFLVPFFTMLFVIGIPLFFLEISIGQFSGLSPIHTFEKMCPLFKGLGYAAILINCFIGFYYNVIIAYCFYYFAYSIRTELPWKGCNYNEPDCFVRYNSTSDCAVEKQAYFDKNITKLRSPSEVYFYDHVLEISDGIENLGGINIHLAVALFVSWLVVFAALSKGVASLGKVSYFTATFPYLMLTILVVKGSLLEGAGEGLKFYVASFNGSKLIEPEIWKDATVQVFYALSTCSGGLISMASFNPFDNNLLRDALLVPILDCMTGFYAGFAIFTVLGQMYITKCVDSFAEVAAQGPELAFVVYPEGLSLMGTAAPIFSALFFIMMLALGFGSEFSIMESAIATTIELFQKQINTPKKIFIARAAICFTFFFFGLTMVTRGGLFILNLIDSVIAGYPLLLVALLEIIVVPWIYGTDRLVKDIESMIGEKPKWFWNIWIYSWKFSCPFVLVAIILSSLLLPSGGLSLKGIPYPFYAKVIGFIIACIPLSAIFIFGAKQAIAFEFNWKKLLTPDDSYYDNYRKHLRLKDAEKSGADVNASSPDVNTFDNVGYVKETNELRLSNISSPVQRF